MNIQEVRPHLYLIGLEQEIEHFGFFISSWVYDGEEKFLVDVGPKASVEQLLAALKVLKIDRLDLIFLTHIHIDHAGGTGALIDRFPGSKVICHESGIPHLIQPQRLWEGSKKVLGDLALKYGEILPVPEENFLSPEQFKRDGFQVIKTPGHAAHHISLVYRDYLFAGEAGGIYLDREETPYLRPGTPPKFILEEATGSIDKLLEVVTGQEICYAHFGMHPDARGMLREYRDQLYLWCDVVAEQMRCSDRTDLTERCIHVLLERDKWFKPFKDFTEKEKSREVYFIQNSIKGMSEYLSSRSEEPVPNSKR